MLAVLAQAVPTIGLTLPVVIHIPEAVLMAGRSTPLGYALALVAILPAARALPAAPLTPPGC